MGWKVQLSLFSKSQLYLAFWDSTAPHRAPLWGSFSVHGNSSWFTTLSLSQGTSSLAEVLPLFPFYVSIRCILEIALYELFCISMSFWCICGEAGYLPILFLHYLFLPLEKTLKSRLDSKEIKLVKSKGNQPWIFTGRSEAEAEGPILWPPDVRADSLEKTLMLGKIKDGRRGWQRMRWLDDIIDAMDILSKLQETVKDREVWHASVHGVAKSPIWLNDWTTIFYHGLVGLFLNFYLGSVDLYFCF